VFHDSFCQLGGAERFAEELHRALSRNAPAALHTTVAAERVLTPQLKRAGIRTTWMQHLPLPHKLFRAYFLLFPFAVDHADLSEYDLIVSSCFGYAKGVRQRTARKGRPAALHICYCHTPMRWVWRTNDYLAREGHARLKSALLALPLRWLKRWEMKAARQPDLFLANSNVVARRLRDAFGVEATVIPPPIDTARFAPLPGHEYDEPEDFYLVLSRLVPYKRFDLAIKACQALKRKLVIIGDGADRSRLETIAAGDPNITFLGRVPDEVVVEYARRTRGLLFPGEEDFGMTPLEVNAAGRAVIAYRAGGATETIIEGLNGLFFEEPTSESLAEAMLRFEDRIWDMDAIRTRAAAFDRIVFRRRLLQFVEAAMEEHKALSAPTGPIMFPSRVAEDLAEFGRRVGRAS
jgi:glycosyltransferase involved in cell wall biosynthesis